MDLKQRIELLNEWKKIRKIRLSKKILNKRLSEETNKHKKEILNRKYGWREQRKTLKQTLKLLDDLRNEIRNFSSYHDKNWRRICICQLFPSQFGPSYANKLNDPKQSIATLAISTLLSRHFYSANLDSQFFNFMSLTYHLGGDTFNIFNSGLRRFLEYTDKNTIKDTFDIFTYEIEEWLENRYDYSSNDHVSSFRQELRNKVEKSGGTELSEFLFDKDITAKSTLTNT